MSKQRWDVTEQWNDLEGKKETRGEKLPPKNKEKEMTPEEQLEQDRQLIWYYLGDGNMRQLRGALLDQEEKTLREWLDVTVTLKHEIIRALSWQQAAVLEDAADLKWQHRAEAHKSGEGEQAANNQSAQAEGNQGG